jgi:hypothetical protein
VKGARDRVTLAGTFSMAWLASRLCVTNSSTSPLHLISRQITSSDASEHKLPADYVMMNNNMRVNTTTIY